MSKPEGIRLILEDAEKSHDDFFTEQMYDTLISRLKERAGIADLRVFYQNATIPDYDTFKTQLGHVKKAIQDLNAMVETMCQNITIPDPSPQLVAYFNAYKQLDDYKKQNLHMTTYARSNPEYVAYLERLSKLHQDVIIAKWAAR